MSSPTWTIYLRWVFITLFGILAATGGVNALMDPLGVLGAPRIHGINVKMPYLDHHRELARFKAAQQVCAKAGIFGNSRSEIGFDPASLAFTGRGLSAFNHAIPGSGLQLALRQLNWLASINCLPETIVLGVDFADFLGGSRVVPLPTIQSAPPPRIDGPFLAETVFSLNGLMDSLTTLRTQRVAHPATITPLGFNSLDNYLDEVASQGHYVLFRQRAEENLRRWRGKPARLRPEDGTPSADEVELRAFVAQATAAGSHVHLVIYPYHAEIRLMLEGIGLGGLLADWKTNIVTLAEQAGRQPAQVEIWDFSGLSAETLEPIPAQGDLQTQLNYYWEAGHFKKALGDKVLARVLGTEGNFGVKLDSGMIQAHVAQDRARVQTELAQDTPLSQEVRDVLRSH
ncbi:hypothetical protein [Zoogloea sp. LCSB751]|uniref:hypothetical protein n=1 Tax=Zoogloea sp. LCSB751 TaxID=1965277 RepID=UPI0009A4864A|nr:hypothetical protein [Zoogloea sp. LCSB751]